LGDGRGDSLDKMRGYGFLRYERGFHREYMKVYVNIITSKERINKYLSEIYPMAS